MTATDHVDWLDGVHAVAPAAEAQPGVHRTGVKPRPGVKLGYTRYVLHTLGKMKVYIAILSCKVTPPTV